MTQLRKKFDDLRAECEQYSRECKQFKMEDRPIKGLAELEQEITEVCHCLLFL